MPCPVANKHNKTNTIMTTEQIKRTLDLHSKWLRGDSDGVRANLSWANLSGSNLSGADLSEADLSGANLSGANLSGADLSVADLSEANLSEANLSWANLSEANLSWANLAEVRGVRVADCQWSAHGEFGRRLIAAELPTGLRFYCGCFNGDADELRAFIEGSTPTLRASRFKAMDFLLSCF